MEQKVFANRAFGSRTYASEFDGLFYAVWLASAEESIVHRIGREQKENIGSF